jgi:hypothetical protein
MPRYRVRSALMTRMRQVGREVRRDQNKSVRGVLMMRMRQVGSKRRNQNEDQEAELLRIMNQNEDQESE